MTDLYDLNLTFPLVLAIIIVLTTKIADMAQLSIEHQDQDRLQL